MAIDSIGDLLSGVGQAVENALTSAQGTLAEALQAITDAANAAGQAISDEFAGIPSSGDFVSQVDAQIEAARQAAIAAATSAAEEAVSGGGVSAVGDAVQAAVNAVTGAITGAGVQGPAIPGQTPGTTPNPDQNPNEQGPAIPGVTPGTTPDQQGVQPAPTTSTLDGIIQDVEDYFQALVDDVEKAVPKIDDIKAFFVDYIPSIASQGFTFVTDNVFKPALNWLNNIALSIKYNIYGIGDPPAGGGWSDTLSSVPLPSTRDESDFFVAHVNDVINQPKGLLEFLLSVFMRGSIALTSIGAALEPLLSQIRQEANTANPVEPLPVGTLVDAQYKGLVTPEVATATALQQGVSVADYNILYGAASYTPTTEEAASWTARGFIDQQAFVTYAAANHALGTVGETIQKATVRPIAPGAALDTVGKVNAQAQGFLPASLGSACPQAIKDLYTHNLQDPTDAANDWLQHWGIPSPEWWANAYYRGLSTAGNVAQAAIAANYPPEIANLFVDISRPIVGQRIAVTLYAKGVIDKPTMTGLLQRAGYADSDIAVIEQYGDSIKQNDSVDSPHSLAKLALGHAAQLYDDGTITDTQLLDIFEEHKYSADAAALEVSYIKLKKAAADRKSAALDIVDSVDEGVYSQEQGVSNLHALGYTNSEVLRYTKMMKAKAKDKVKSPTEAQIKALYKAGLINGQAVSDYYSQGGYEPTWAALLASLIVSPPAAATDTGTGT